MKIANTIKTSVTVAFTALFLSLVSFNAQAADKIKNPPVDVKYVGSVDYNPVFQVEFDNQDGEELQFSLKDSYGTIIYTETVKDKKFSKKFQVNSEDASSMKLTLSLRSKRGSSTQVFQINRSTRQVDEVVISKL